MDEPIELIEFRVWQSWMRQSGRCQATTCRGRQCLKESLVMGSEVCNYSDFDDVEFILGVTDRCHIHVTKESVS